jgi:periplasmic nitrate reductase NapD
MRQNMKDASAPPALDRRTFINGHWATLGSVDPKPVVEIASVLVQARPDRLDAALRAIEALPGTQICSRDPRGKAVVVLEGSNVGVIGSLLNGISLLPDVLTAALVFHATDEG